MEKFIKSKIIFENMIDVEFRNYIEQAVEDYGFVFIGGGCNLLKKSMDISFEKKEISQEEIK